MNDETLFLLSLFFSALGILALFYLAKAFEPVALSPGEVSGEFVGKTVLVKGTVESAASGRTFKTFSLCRTKCVKVIDFGNREPPERGSFVSVEGTVKEYRGEIEVVAEIIEVN